MQALILSFVVFNFVLGVIYWRLGRRNEKLCAIAVDKLDRMLASKESHHQVEHKHTLEKRLHELQRARFSQIASRKFDK